MIHHGDCLDVMATFEPESIDAIVTDPPYGLGFMGKAWDTTSAMHLPPSAEALDSPLARFRTGKGPAAVAFEGKAFQAWCEQWAREAFRIAKPGAYLLAFGGTRTYHRLAAAIEDAGWEIRDTLVWAYASGFPKSLNLTGDRQGWGTALKPAWEPIVMARKPLRGTVAGNVTEYGTGALNIDGCRIASTDVVGASGRWGFTSDNGWNPNSVPSETSTVHEHTNGRWPANVILTDPIFDGDTPGVVGGGEVSGQVGMSADTALNFTVGTHEPGQSFQRGAKDSGTYSRFFLIPKAARTDREPVLGGLPEMEMQFGGAVSDEVLERYASPGETRNGYNRIKQRQNVHPTVKPTELMRHLVRLVTPPGGIVLDPFLGSGTTALAAEMEGFEWLGIEREAEYVAIAEARLNGTQRGLGLAG